MAATKKKKTLKKAGDVNKSAWIREQDPSLKAGELVELGAKQGIEITAGLVYATRHQEKAKADGGSKKRAGRSKKATATASGSDQTEFLKLAAKLGVDQAQELLDVLKSL